MMTSPAHTCDIDDELALTLEGMNRHGIRRIPVLEDGHPIGLLVLDDILHHVSGELVEISYEARSRRDHPTSQEAPPGANQREHLLKDLDERLDELRAKLRERQLARAGGLPGRVGRCEVTPAPGPAHGHLRASGHPVIRGGHWKKRSRWQRPVCLRRVLPPRSLCAWGSPAWPTTRNPEFPPSRAARTLTTGGRR